jgi:hypothetical protein
VKVSVYFALKSLAAIETNAMTEKASPKLTNLLERTKFFSYFVQTNTTSPRKTSDHRMAVVQVLKVSYE